MKKRLLLLATTVLVGSMGLAGCGSAGDTKTTTSKTVETAKLQTPEQTITQYISDMSNKKYQEAYALLSPQSQKHITLDQVKKDLEKSSSFELYKTLDKKTNGDMALYTIMLKIGYEGAKGYNYALNSVPLVKENNEWHILWDLNSITEQQKWFTQTIQQVQKESEIQQQLAWMQQQDEQFRQNNQQFIEQMQRDAEQAANEAQKSADQAGKQAMYAAQQSAQQAQDAAQQSAQQSMDAAQQATMNP